MARAGTRKSKSGGLQIPLFEPESSWSPPSLDSLPDWSLAKRVGLDTETRDDRLKDMGPGVRRGGFIAGVSFAIEDGPAFYLPMRHLGGGNLPVEGVMAYLRDQAARFTGQIVGANLPYDLDYLAESGVVFRRAERFRDIQIADPLCYELHQSYSLDSIAKRRGFDGKNEGLLREAAGVYNIDAKNGMWMLPSKFVGPYAEEDARLVLPILRRCERDIDEQDLWEIYNLESDLLPVLVKMRRRGVRVDLDKLDQVERWALAQETEALALVHQETGCRIAVGDVWKREVIKPALRAIGIVLLEDASLDKDFLASIRHPVAEKIAWARKVNKLRTTFAHSIREHMVGDRIHTTFNQMRRTKEDGDEGGARYGRLSSENPNLQQQPSRDEFAKMWREIYVPEHGEQWGSCDYSQQEPRWVTHFAEALRLPRAFEAAERYRNDPSTDNHTMMTQLIHGDDVTSSPDFKKHRRYCKEIYLGLCYGMGGPKLARKIDLPTKWIETRSGRKIEVAGDEAQAILDKFDNAAPFVRRLSSIAEDQAKKNGFIKTVGGRRCRFPKDEKSGDYDWTHKALNRLIQGSSADQTKKAMVDADRAGIRLQLQVHDEMGQSVAQEAVAYRLADIMRDAYRARVPFKIDVEIGDSWGGSM